MGEWVSVARADEVLADTPLVVDLDDGTVVLARVGDDIVAIEDLCTHDGGEISEGCIVEGAIECPRHGARFCLRTGEVLSPPAYESLHIFPVRIEDGMVRVCDDRWD
ncbi:MAG: ferredoxin [Acidiferrobacteraceae bacterium]|nr:ferredoxin [Acidiferrobacteraceae bacterium]MCP4827912.1 non-heme iron oxygenase ferredoxin subunit [Pseudomonadota bacterium]